MKKYWKKLFLRYFDFDGSGKTEWWEVGIVIGVIIIFELIIEVIANLITK